jgi:hypothetical protein
MDEISLYISVPLKLDPTIFKSPERVISTHPHVKTGAILLAPLSDEDIAREDRLARHGSRSKHSSMSKITIKAQSIGNRIKCKDPDCSEVIALALPSGLF